MQVYSERACRHDRIIVNKSGIVEELATFHDKYRNASNKFGKRLYKYLETKR